MTSTCLVSLCRWSACWTCSLPTSPWTNSTICEFNLTSTLRANSTRYQSCESFPLRDVVFSHPEVTWWCRSWGRTWGRCWGCSGCQKKRSSIWFIRCSEVWRWRTLLWSHTVGSLLVDVIVLWIKSLFYSFITVHSLCWHHSQGKLSFNTLCVCDKHCVHTSNYKAGFLYRLCSLCYRWLWRYFTFLWSYFLYFFCRTSNQETSPSTKTVSSRYLEQTTTKLLAINAFTTPASSEWVRCTCLLVRSWTLVWRGRPTARWRDTWWLDGTEPRRSSWAGCATLRRVMKSSSHRSTEPSLLFL